MTDNHAFRRGVHAGVQAVVTDFTALVARRVAANSPELTTQTIVAMTRRIAEQPYPTEDPGPADTATPDVPAEPRPTTDMLLHVAALAAEESGLPIQMLVSSDGVGVYGTNGGRASLHAVKWNDIATSSAPVLSIAVQQVIDELRS